MRLLVLASHVGLSSTVCGCAARLWHAHFAFSSKTSLTQQMVGAGMHPTWHLLGPLPRPPTQSYRADFRWLVSACPDLLHAPRLLLLHGHQKRSADPYNRWVGVVGPARRVPRRCSGGGVMWLQGMGEWIHANRIPPPRQIQG